MIDEIDYKIIELLQNDARLSNATLAEKLEIPTSTVHGRVKRLEQRGIITGYKAIVDPEKLGKPIIAFIRLTVGMTDDYKAAKQTVVDVCLAEPDILECHGVAGEDCYIMKVHAATPQDLEKLLEEVRCQVQVSQSITSIVLSTVKVEGPLLPYR